MKRSTWQVCVAVCAKERISIMDDSVAVTTVPEHTVPLNLKLHSFLFRIHLQKGQRTPIQPALRSHHVERFPIRGVRACQLAEWPRSYAVPIVCMSAYILFFVESRASLKMSILVVDRVYTACHQNIHTIIYVFGYNRIGGGS